ncbi:hypothetical protein [Williamsia sp. M5A3_1d]
MTETLIDTTPATDAAVRRAEWGQFHAVVAVILAVVTTLPSLDLVTTSMFALTPDSGTADLSGLWGSAVFAVPTVVCAVLAAVMGRNRSRSVGLFILIAPVLCLMALG